MPLHPPEAEVSDLWRWVNRWLRHYENVPEASAQGEALCFRAEEVARDLLEADPDPLVWSHGDLHDKQILTTDGPSLLGLLDFDDTAQAEAARDLANMDVLLELRARQSRISPARYLTVHNQILAAAEELHVSPGRFNTYSDVVWLRKACSPLPRRSSMALSTLAERAAHRDRRTKELMS
jgi:aminoglycoside phosphotransferase (APT) family kinase protein